MKVHLRKIGYEIIHKKNEDFGPDIKVRKDGITEFYEVETKTDYEFNNETDFRFNTVHFLARKEKWADVGFWYVLICPGTLAYVKCHSSVIYKEGKLKVIKIDSKERLGEDRFYDVPKDRCEWSRIPK
jgi:hypothetical protein